MIELTEYGEAIYKEAKEVGLDPFYNEFNGNFGFTENELFENMNEILMWLETHKDYRLLYQDGYDNWVCWWLTDFDE